MPHIIAESHDCFPHVHMCDMTHMSRVMSHMWVDNAKYFLLQLLMDSLCDNTLQHTLQQTLQHTATHTATHCNTLQRTATHSALQGPLTLSPSLSVGEHTLGDSNSNLNLGSNSNSNACARGNEGDEIFEICEVVCLLIFFFLKFACIHSHVYEYTSHDSKFARLSACWFFFNIACDMSRSYGWHDPFICVTWLIHMADMTHLRVRHDSSTCVTWLIHVWHVSLIWGCQSMFATCAMTRPHVWRDAFVRDMSCTYVWHDWFIRVTFFFRKSRVRVRHDSFVRVAWLIRACDMTHSCVAHDSFVYVVTRSCIWHDSFISHVTSFNFFLSERVTSHICHMDESCHTDGWVTSHIWMSHVTHMDESRHTYGWVMSHTWMSHGTHMDESRHIYGWATSHAHTHECHTYTHMNRSCHTYE